MLPRLIAFDLDGTLLRSDKRLSSANKAALADMEARGCVIALASGRLGSSMMPYVNELRRVPALITLNGAAVYERSGAEYSPLYTAPVPARYADELIRYTSKKIFALNYYIDDKLYSIRTAHTAKWHALYHRQTGTDCVFVDSLMPFLGRSPDKAIFVGEPKELDKQEKLFRPKWGGDLYIVRTWDYYLEFLNPEANKGKALQIIAAHFGIDLRGAAAFGDADNDIPMLRKAGVSIAMRNATEACKRCAQLVSPWTNDDDGVAREWERMKKESD